MTTQELVRKVVEALEQLGVPYMIVGSFSSNAYGVARNTQDADFVVQLDCISIGQIAAQLSPDFRFDPQMSFETITAITRYILESLVENFVVEFFCLAMIRTIACVSSGGAELRCLGRPHFLRRPKML